MCFLITQTHSRDTVIIILAHLFTLFHTWCVNNIFFKLKKHSKSLTISITFYSLFLSLSLSLSVSIFSILCLSSNIFSLGSNSDCNLMKRNQTERSQRKEKQKKEMERKGIRWETNEEDSNLKWIKVWQVILLRERWEREKTFHREWEERGGEKWRERERKNLNLSECYSTQVAIIFASI